RALRPLVRRGGRARRRGAPDLRGARRDRTRASPSRRRTTGTGRAHMSSTAPSSAALEGGDEHGRPEAPRASFGGGGPSRRLRIADLSLHAEMPTTLERALTRLRGARGVVAGALIVCLAWLLARAPFGGAMLGVLLGVIALWLRATRLDTPFAFDADVQRLFT